MARAPHPRAVPSNPARAPQNKAAQFHTNTLKMAGNIRANKPVNKTVTNQLSGAKTTGSNTGSNKKLMKRIETVKKNSQGEVISREIKLVPIEDETDECEEQSVMNHGKVMRKSAPVSPSGFQQTGNRTVVSGNSGSRSVISPGQAPRQGNRAVIRVNPTPGDKGTGDQRNVVSQQGSNRVSVE
jgi:hypothetical protein